jgi:hypothetical protein
MDKTFVIDLMWDPEADVYVATSDDVPGLATEAGSLDALIERVKAIVPELLRDNGILTGQSSRHLSLSFTARRSETIRTAA